IQVETHAQAQDYQFVGSPTIRVNGADLFPIEQANYALGCRVYQTPTGFRGVPTEEMVKAQLASVLV
ncbi:MAG: thioredoxin family protein, partial [Chloroflexota bacterium]